MHRFDSGPRLQENIRETNKISLSMHCHRLPLVRHFFRPFPDRTPDRDRTIHWASTLAGRCKVSKRSIAALMWSACG
jgi:hypothetical protein